MSNEQQITNADENIEPLMLQNFKFETLIVIYLFQSNKNIIKNFILKLS